MGQGYAMYEEFQYYRTLIWACLPLPVKHRPVSLVGDWWGGGEGKGRGSVERAGTRTGTGDWDWGVVN